MSSKSDRDNRSNQLNPNNSAYHSSRAGNALDDDCDDDQSYRRGINLENYRTVSPKLRMEGAYGVGFVTANGEPRFFTFKLEVSENKSIFLGQDSRLKARLEDYMERFTGCLLWLVSTHYKARPNLFVIFDGTSSRLPWHAPFDPERPDLMTEFLLKEKIQIEGGADPEKTLSKLLSVLQPPYENWGTFEVEERGASTLKFIYERRCRDALANT